MTTANKLNPKLYQQLLTCLRGTWHSLTVVPASPTQSAAVVASALVEVSNLVRGQQARLFAMEAKEVRAVSMALVDITQHVDAGGLAIVSVDSVIAQQSGVPVTIATDASLLVVQLGVTKMEDAKRTIELIGEKKFIGAVVIEP